MAFASVAEGSGEEQSTPRRAYREGTSARPRGHALVLVARCARINLSKTMTKAVAFSEVPRWPLR
jgi:hypothetical protein